MLNRGSNNLPLIYPYTTPHQIKGSAAEQQSASLYPIKLVQL